MSKRRVNMGVIGAGRIGRLHAQHVALRVPSAQLAAIADINFEAAQDCAARIGMGKPLADYHEILTDPEIDAVVIASPTDQHARMVEEAAAHGKHIFCEKPIDQSLVKIDCALDAVREAGVKLQVGFNRRFDANFARVRAAIAQGSIGQPRLLHIISRDPGPPPIEYVKVSGGMFLDMTIHDFDMARFLIGDEVEEVYASAGVMVDLDIGAAGDIDTAVITLRFRNGVIGTIDNCREAVYGYDQRVEVLGSKGAVHTENNYPNTAIVSGADFIRRDLPLNFFMDRYIDSFVSEMAVFVEAVRLDLPVPVTGEDARVPVVMALAAKKSFDEHRPVRLDEIG